MILSSVRTSLEGFCSIDLVKTLPRNVVGSVYRFIRTVKRLNFRALVDLIDDGCSFIIGHFGDITLSLF
ncbi:hypothetical protein, partial [Colwellia marinimaniae]|uniref:hypothetical protein n=1 Tax=Colwellia marinimaniae TaxID=1513592 RepID=UPI001F15EBBC